MKADEFKNWYAKTHLDYFTWNEFCEDTNMNISEEENKMMEAFAKHYAKPKIIEAYNRGALAVGEGRFLTEGNSAEDYYEQLKRIEGKPKITDDDEGVESCMNCGKYFYQIGNEDLCSRCYTLT